MHYLDAAYPLAQTQTHCTHFTDTPNLNPNSIDPSSNSNVTFADPHICFLLEQSVSVWTKNNINDKIYSVWPKVCHNGGGANARFVFCQLNSNIVNTIISTKALT